jgi:hypothetical protein
MPNHVKNILTVTGKREKINLLKNFVHDEEEKNPFSLNNILPMPPEDEMEDGYINNMPNWYNWRIENWGTKWNTYDIEMTRIDHENINYIFLTAWASPVNALIILSSKFPTLVFKLEYADEDIGNNCGYIEIVDGHIVQDIVPTDNEAVEHALDIWDLHEQYEFVDGEYRYKENFENWLN